MKSIITIVVTLFFTQIIVASDKQDSAETPERFGPGKAIEAFSKEDGFKLSEKAMKSLGVKFQSIQGVSPWKLPAEAIVRIKQSTGVYRRYEGWISLVLVKVLKEENGVVLIQSTDLENNDEVSVMGASYLRMTDSDLNAGTVDSCAH